jgi:broad specificity phosphatase PhoE
MIYLVRHGESIANTKSIYQGQTYDTKLSTLGKLQAKAMAKHLARISLDCIICSPLRRTHQTAKIVSKFTKIKVETNRDIIETNHGLWEGLHKENIAKNWPQLYLNWFINPSEITFPDGESFLQTQMRVIRWWAEIKEDKQNILIVSHDNILRIIISDVLKMNLDDIWQFHLHPAAITIIENNKLVCLNDKNHLIGLETDLSTHAL